MVKLFFVCCWTSLALLHAQELFTQKKILEYLNDSNPYYYSLLAQQYIAKKREGIFEGAFDTKLRAKYEEKSYPLSIATYKEATLEKPFYNGMELAITYRAAQGTQEYNNIKTGQDGEILTSIKMPILNMLHNTSRRNISYKLSKLQTSIRGQESRSKLTRLYFKISQLYFETLYKKEILQVHKKLLLKAEKRLQYIQSEIKVGNLPKIALLEIQSQIIRRKQKVLDAKNNLNKSKNQFLKYLNLSNDAFDSHYIFPALLVTKKTLFNNEECISLAFENRAELKKIAYEKERITKKQKFNDIEKFPKLDVNLLGVHDIYYKRDGYKASINFSFPLQRRAYKGKKEVLQKERLYLNSLQAQLQNNITTNIKNILQSMATYKQNIALVHEELLLRTKLERVEQKKYKEGLSNLNFINQREIDSLQSQKRLLKYSLDIELLQLSLSYEMGYKL